MALLSTVAARGAVGAERAAVMASKVLAGGAEHTATDGIAPDHQGLPMPTFFFDTEIDGEASLDTDGVLLPDFATARHEARVALCELAAELEVDRDATLAMMHVRDGRGTIVLTLHMQLTVRAGVVADP